MRHANCPCRACRGRGGSSTGADAHAHADTRLARIRRFYSGVRYGRQAGPHGNTPHGHRCKRPRTAAGRPGRWKMRERFRHWAKLPYAIHTGWGPIPLFWSEAVSR